VLGLFMLSAWHGERQLTAEEVVQHRAHATERKRREIEFLSPDGNPAHLCNFTGVARGMSVALRRQFTADEFKAVVVEFDSKAGKHKGVSGLNVDRLEALLASKGVTLDQFTAAMFTSVLNPERFCALKANIAEVKAKVDEKEREREAKRRKTSGEEDAPAPAKPKPKPKQPVVEKEAPAPRASRQRRAPSSDAAAAPPEATPAVAKPLRVAVQEPQLCLYDSVMPTPTALGAAPSAELIDSPLSFLETMKQVATKVQAANEEATLLFSEDPEVYSEDPVVASAKLGAELGLVIPLGAATSWERPGLAAAPSVGGALGPASSALGRLPSLGLAPSTSAMQGMLMAMAHPELSLPALQHHAAECAPAATAMYGALGPAVSEWIPASISGASTAPSGGLAPATSASATFATISLARTTSLQRSRGSGGAAFLIPEGAFARKAPWCVRFLTCACRRPRGAGPSGGPRQPEPQA
jgi:hypothetical protein